MALKLKYQGQEASKNKNEYTYKQTYTGTKQEVENYIASLPAIGTKNDTKGYLRRWTQTQEEGIFWNAEIEYGISYDSSSFSDDDQTVVGKKSAQLSVRNMQMPLESHPNYRTIWNHYLASNNGMAPQWATDTTDVLISGEDRKHYMWIKSLGQLPMDADEQGNMWQIVVDMEKKGVEYYDMALFVVTISAKYNSASSAGSAISSNINSIVSPSEDFGLGGQWKYDQANVSYDGKSWIATSVYTRAIDKWDKDLYE